MKKQINININYSVHSLEELQHVIKTLDCKTGKININLDTLKSVHVNQSQTSIEDTQSVDEIRKIMLNNGYVDLGLPSGTLWKFNYSEKYIDYQTACKAYKLPTEEQIQELFAYCKVFMLDRSVKFVSAINKNYITLVRYGYRSNGNIRNKGVYLFTQRNEGTKNNVTYIDGDRNSAEYKFLKAEVSEHCSVLLCSKPLQVK